MARLAICLLYAAAALRGSMMIATRRDPSLTILLLVLFGLLLLAEPWITARLASQSPHLLDRFHIAYMLVQIGLVLGMLLPDHTPDVLMVLFFPLAYQAVRFFGWRSGRWWIATFALPMMLYVLLHDDINNLIMAPIFESASFLLGTLAYFTQRAETARSDNLRLAQELRLARRELEKYARQVEELAAEKTRILLARELHDSVTQTVFSMNLAVEAARLLLSKGPAAEARQLERVQGLAESAISEIGKLVSQSGPPSGKDQGFAGVIRRLAAGYGSSGELEVGLDVNGEREFPPGVTENLYSIIRETLINVKKHAGTRQVSIRLDLDGSPARVTVEDCGRGFDPRSALSRPGHLGLIEMTERAREAGWKLDIDSKPGQGTCVNITELEEGMP